MTFENRKKQLKKKEKPILWYIYTMVLCSSYEELKGVQNVVLDENIKAI